MVQQTDTPVQIRAALPARLQRNFGHDFGRQPEMMKLFIDLFGPYPLSSGYTVVVTDDDLEIPVEAQGFPSSAPITATARGPTSGWTPTNWPISGSAIR
jgi:hypothetical protein